MRVLNLYTTSSCHLCETAQALITPLLAAHHLSLRLLEISDSDGLIERYGVRIPVLRLEGSDLELGWPFNEQSFLEFIKA